MSACTLKLGSAQTTALVHMHGVCCVHHMDQSRIGITYCCFVCNQHAHKESSNTTNFAKYNHHYHHVVTMLSSHVYVTLGFDSGFFFLFLFHFAILPMSHVFNRIAHL